MYLMYGTRDPCLAIAWTWRRRRPGKRLATSASNPGKVTLLGLNTDQSGEEMRGEIFENLRTFVFR
jgi:hypothetical protein